MKTKKNYRIRVLYQDGSIEEREVICDHVLVTEGNTYIAKDGTTAIYAYTPSSAVEVEMVYTGEVLK